MMFLAYKNTKIGFVRDLAGKKSIKNGTKIDYSIPEVLARFKRDFGAPQSFKYWPELQIGGLWGNG